MNVDKKEAVFRVENQLIYGDVVLLLQSYQTEGAYQNFLYRVSSLIEEDELILAAFPASIGKVLEIINKK